MNALIYVDGGSRRGGKLAAIGVSLCTAAGQELLAYSASIGPATCVEAEYHALLAGLRLAGSLAIDTVEVRSDSQLVVLQTKGRCRCAAPRLVVLHAEVRRTARAFTKFRITHVCREDNQRADALVNLAFSERGNRLTVTEARS